MQDGLALQLWLAVVAGFFNGFTHCAGMCGPIVLSFSVVSKSVNGGLQIPFWTRLIPHLLYNSGRILTYTILGLGLGSVGMVLDKSLLGTPLMGMVQVAGGLLVVLMSLGILIQSLALRFSFLWNFTHGFVLRSLSRFKNRHAFFGGMTLGFLPCGLVYAMLIVSLALPPVFFLPHPLASAAIMFAFGLGTFPAMAIVGFFGEGLSPVFRQGMRFFSAVFLAFYGVWMILEGLGVFQGHHHVGHSCIQ